MPTLGPKSNEWSEGGSRGLRESQLAGWGLGKPNINWGTAKYSPFKIRFCFTSKQHNTQTTPKYQARLSEEVCYHLWKNQTPVLHDHLSTCHVGASFDPLAKQQRLHTLGHGDDDVGSAHCLLHRGTHLDRAAHRLTEPLRSLSGVVPYTHLWGESWTCYTSITVFSSSDSYFTETRLIHSDVLCQKQQIKQDLLQAKMQQKPILNYDKVCEKMNFAILMKNLKRKYRDEKSTLESLPL